MAVSSSKVSTALQTLKIGGMAIGLGASAVLAGRDIIALKEKVNQPNKFNTPSLFVYPSNLPVINGQTFCILFHFYLYDRPSILQTPNLIDQGAIALPLPNNLTDHLQLSYNSGSHSSPALGAALEASKYNYNENMISNVETSALNITDAAAHGGALQGLSVAAAKATADQAALNKMLQLGGMAQNPFLSVLFNDPAFNQYNFTWTFIPENASDTETLKTILDKFRYHACPGIGQGTAGTLLSYPDMVVPILFPTPYMFDFKQCVVTDIAVNYIPGNTPAFFPQNNAPNTIRLSLTLLEIEYWTKSDFLNNNYHSANFVSSNTTSIGLQPWSMNTNSVPTGVPLNPTTGGDNSFPTISPTGTG